jgi:pimeloyl-ACP methyl ester carboxylesterase
MRLGSVVTSRGNVLRVSCVDGRAASGRERPPVVLVHPINLRKECWLGLLPALAADRGCVLVDLAGHGESTDDEAFSLDAWVADCTEVVEGLGLDELHVVGGSLGGAIAIGLAAALPDRIRSITGLGSSVAPHPAGPDEAPAPGTAEQVDALFATLAREAVAPGTAEEVVTTVRLLTNQHGAEVVKQILRAAYVADATPWLADVSCPALWATGEHDVTCSLEESTEISAAMGGTHVPLAGVGHLGMIENPELVLEHLRPHLEAADAASRGS